jgi:hypothetical protein
MAVRLAVLLGRLPAAALAPGDNWPSLHQTWDAMAEAQTWQPGDPDDHLNPNAEPHHS